MFLPPSPPLLPNVTASTPVDAQNESGRRLPTSLCTAHLTSFNVGTESLILAGITDAGMFSPRGGGYGTVEFHALFRYALGCHSCRLRVWSPAALSHPLPLLQDSWRRGRSLVRSRSTYPPAVSAHRHLFSFRSSFIARPSLLVIYRYLLSFRLAETLSSMSLSVCL